MRKVLPWAVALVLSGAAATAYAAPKKATKAAPGKSTTAPQATKAPEPKLPTLKCVGLYSETDAGSISYKSGAGSWAAIRVGDTISADAEIKVTVDRDWVELTPSDNPGAVYELNGEKGPVTRSAADVLKGTPKAVKLPKPTGDAPDPAFKDKLVVMQYLGRQVYTDANGDDRDIKYGDVLEPKGKVAIIAINNTLTLMNAGGKVTTVVGPLKFDVEKVLKNEKLYKFLNTGR